MRFHVVVDRAEPLRLGLIGFGHVGRGFSRLLADREAVLRERYGVNYRVTAILTANHGWVVDDTGLDLPSFQSVTRLPERGLAPNIARLPVDVVIEMTTLNPVDGEPALSYLREALTAGMHAITANKGPIAYGLWELQDLARKQEVQLRYEAAVADDLPLFNLVRDCLPAATIRQVDGIFNSTTNYVLSQVAAGHEYEAALADAQRAGIAERNPEHDLHGWDAALKGVIVGASLLDARVGPATVHRTICDEALAAAAREAAATGQRLRLITSVQPDRISLDPQRLGPDSLFYAVDGFSMGVQIETDVAGSLFVSLKSPGVEQTAFGLLADLVSLTKA